MTIIIHLICKNWPSYSKRLELPVQAAQEAFNRGQRHDSLGKWGRLSEVDPRTGVPRELNDEEVLQHGIGRGEHDDPTGDHALGRYRTNQVLSTFVRGVIQLGYRRQHFLVDNHIREGTEVDTSMVHSSCAALWCKLVGKITGYRQFSMLSPRSRHSPSFIFNIDPFGICQLWGPKDCTPGPPYGPHHVLPPGAQPSTSLRSGGWAETEVLKASFKGWASSCSPVRLFRALILSERPVDAYPHGAKKMSFRRVPRASSHQECMRIPDRLIELCETCLQFRKCEPWQSFFSSSPPPPHRHGGPEG